MKKPFIFIVAAYSILLSGCFGGDDANNAKPITGQTEGFHEYATEEFKILIPDDWEILTPLNFKNGTPSNTIVAFRNNVRNPSFTANVAIVKNELSEEIQSIDYAKTLFQKTTDDLLDYREVRAEDTNIIVSGKENKTIFLHAEGKETADADMKRFIQISGVKGKTAYIAIGSFLASEGDSMGEKIEKMIRGFGVK